MTVKQLNHSALFFFAFIMVAVAFCQLTAKNYGASNKQVAQIISDDGAISYAGLHAILSADQTNGYLIVDLRPEQEFRAGHIPGAINIPHDQLLKRKHQRTFKRANEILLYSDQEHLSVAASITLMGQAHENVRVIPGNFQTIKQFVIEVFAPAHAHHNDDKARFDYPRFMNVKPVTPARETPIRPGIPQVEDSTPVAGGC